MQELPGGYENCGKIGEGAFGYRVTPFSFSVSVVRLCFDNNCGMRFRSVFKAKHIATGEVFALKKLRLRQLDKGIPKVVLREIKTLEMCSHPNVIRLHEVCVVIRCDRYELLCCLTVRE